MNVDKENHEKIDKIGYTNSYVPISAKEIGKKDEENEYSLMNVDKENHLKIDAIGYTNYYVPIYSSKSINEERYLLWFFDTHEKNCNGK